MRAPQRKRPMVREIVQCDPQRLAAAARQATYVGSPEHKSGPSFAGQPRPRADASLCDPALAQRQPDITGWLCDAIRLGNVGGRWESGFPRYVWSRQGGRVYEARLTNAELGQYKGYPIADDEAPEGMRT